MSDILFECVKETIICGVEHPIETLVLRDRLKIDEKLGY